MDQRSTNSFVNCVTSVSQAWFTQAPTSSKQQHRKPEEWAVTTDYIYIYHPSCLNLTCGFLFASFKFITHLLWKRSFQKHLFDFPQIITRRCSLLAPWGLHQAVRGRRHSSKRTFQVLQAPIYQDKIIHYLIRWEMSPCACVCACGDEETWRGADLWCKTV